jgi:hypothetical protein
MRTEAESLFEQFCIERQIAYQRIPEGAGKTPDYEITLAGRRIAVEVKQLEPNVQDRAFFEELLTTGHAGGAVDTGRARSAIQDALKQLRPYAKGHMPAVVLLYDTMGSAIGYLDADCLADCLYGEEKVHYLVPSAPVVDAIYRGMSRGGNSVATSTHNTTLSALAVLRRLGRGGALDLAIYLNIHAAIPLTVEECAQHGLRQYKFAAPQPGHMPEWIEWRP